MALPCFRYIQELVENNEFGIYGHSTIRRTQHFSLIDNFNILDRSYDMFLQQSLTHA